jgi:hypothetical protein
MPKEVAAANHNADVSVNALAVGLPDGTFSITSVDKSVSPYTLLRVSRFGFHFLPILHQQQFATRITQLATI